MMYAELRLLAVAFGILAASAIMLYAVFYGFVVVLGIYARKREVRRLHKVRRSIDVK